MKKRTSTIMDMVFKRTVYLMTLIQLSRVGAQFVDSFIMSRAFGRTAIAAAGLVAPYFIVISLIGGLIATGCQNLCSRSLGAGDKDAANIAFSTGMALGLFVSIVFGAAVYAFATPICATFGANASTDILPVASAYLRILALGAPGLIVGFILAPIVQLEGGRKPLSIATLVTFGGDVVFDLLAVALGWGIAGIALATTLAGYLSLLVYIIFLCKNRTMIIFSMKRVDFRVGWTMTKKGSPDAAKRLFRVLRDFLTNYLVLILGTDVAMAGKTVGDTLVNLLTCLGIGVSSSVFLLSGFYIGEKNRRGMEILIHRALVNIGVTALIALAAILAAPGLLHMFLPSLDPAQQPEAVFCVRAMLAQMPFFVGFEAYTSYLQSIGKRLHANLVAFCGLIAFYVPVMLFFSEMFGPVGTLVSIPISFALALMAYYAYLWFRHRRMPSLDDFFYLTEQFGAGDAVELDMALMSMEDVGKCMDAALALLKGEGISANIANRIALIIEELCMNTITHGFPTVSTARRVVEVRLLVKSDGIILRIQDNCKHFNVTEKYREIQQTGAGPEDKMGLILVNSFADDIRYLSTLSLNNMIVMLRRDASRSRDELLTSKGSARP